MTQNQTLYTFYWNRCERNLKEMGTYDACRQSMFSFWYHINPSTELKEALSTAGCGPHTPIKIKIKLLMVFLSGNVLALKLYCEIMSSRLIQLFGPLMLSQVIKSWNSTSKCVKYLPTYIPTS